MNDNYDREFLKELEESILGAILVNDSDELKATVLKHNLQPDDFHVKHHQYLFHAVLSSWRDGVKIDIVSINNYKPAILQKDVFNSWTVMNIELVEKISTAAHIEQHILKFKEFILIRFWNRTAERILNLDWTSTDVLTTSDNVIKAYNTFYKRLTKDIAQNKENDYMTEITDKANRLQSGKSTSVSTGCQEFNELIQGGYVNGELMIIAGRPGMLKTTIALISAWETHKQGNPVAFFSLEMPTNQLRSKIISKETGVPYMAIKSGNLDINQLMLVKEMSERLDESNFHIIGNEKHIDDISLKTRELVEAGNCRIMFLDYLQRASHGQQNVREGITYITRELKSIAKDNYIPVIALSQLNRAVEERTDKRPKLRDLKESSSIEEDADIVIFPFRPAYYTLQEGLNVAKQDFWKVEMNIAKGRDIGIHSTILDINPIDLTMKSHSYFLE